jgi:hypothetical protein
MERHQGKTYTGESVLVDGQEFSRCTFSKCTFVYSGGEIPVFDHSQIDACSWRFDGHAERTIHLMAALYRIGFKNVVDGTIDAIRGQPVQGLGRA